MSLKKLGYYLKRILPGVKKIIILNNSCILVIEKAWLIGVLQILKTNLFFCMVGLLDIWGVDYPDKEERFEVNYLLVSYKYNLRIIVRVTTNELSGILTSSNLFASANWLEREVWDMYGIFFYNHMDLRRILTDYGFEGFPLRKDFPLSGFVEIRYDDTEKKIVQELVEIAQDYRIFNFKSPWIHI